MPLNFLFTAEGIATAFPHYACASQSLIVKVDFANPLAFINTAISVDPTAIDVKDTNHKERIYINRLNAYTMFRNNIANTCSLLYFQKYMWLQPLSGLLANYTRYNWITRNYEKIMKKITLDMNGVPG